MRKAAGIMLIILGVVLPLGTAGQLLTYLYLAGVPFVSVTAHRVTIVALVLMALIILSGVSALQRASWGIALAGAILCVLITLPLVVLVDPGSVIWTLIAVLPVVFLVARRGEFRAAEDIPEP